MQLVVVSDNHGKNEPLSEIRNRYPQAQAYIHCGDSELPPEMLEGYTTVMGNNDYFYDYPNYLVLEIADLRIFVIHGHRLTAANRLEQLAALAKKHRCTLACYGHTHVYDCSVIDGVTLVNPGSLWRSRDGRKPSYALITVTDKKLSVQRIEI
ncbi:MAG: metallophosphoesterase [Erysipelotrichaceae bacterium]|nr:metallophosphoesterase [Erysipelotrichaceae bacterium]